MREGINLVSAKSKLAHGGLGLVTRMGIVIRNAIQIKRVRAVHKSYSRRPYKAIKPRRAIRLKSARERRAPGVTNGLGDKMRPENTVLAFRPRWMTPSDSVALETETGTGR